MQEKSLPVVSDPRDRGCSVFLGSQDLDEVVNDRVAIVGCPLLIAAG